LFRLAYTGASWQSDVLDVLSGFCPDCNVLHRICNACIVLLGSNRIDEDPNSVCWARLGFCDLDKIFVGLRWPPPGCWNATGVYRIMAGLWRSVRVCRWRPMVADVCNCFHNPSWFQRCHGELHVAFACFHWANMGCAGVLVSSTAFDGLLGSAMICLSSAGFGEG